MVVHACFESGIGLCKDVIGTDRFWRGISFFWVKLNNVLVNIFWYSRVQNMSAAAIGYLLCETEWLTEDFLQRIQSNSDLCRRLQDPTFMHAIAEFQANPQAAMQKYGDNAAMQAFFHDFCSLLGLLLLYPTCWCKVKWLQDLNSCRRIICFMFPVFW